ncbi:ABC transporter ATP-binding protein [Halomicrococcus gelatinilyticus]|uniref:ABC transporter ATP-binding protein n=1 Tax=Halomicrococcus gelatinilyticus TaxID=1702103 RepID=UPI002E0F1BEC
MPAIGLTGVTMQFGDVTALRDLDLTVQEGEIFGFLGPNGAGKSTTINVLLDFIQPTSGKATVLGHDSHEESHAIRQRIGVLPDGFQVYDRLTGLQHVEFAIDSKESNDDPMAVLDRVGIPEAADRKAGEYSKGMAQRLALGMALVGDPDLIILDEPSTGLDPNGAREMREIIMEENQRGATVFFSSHILEQVEAVCDRVGILNEGQLVAEDSIRGLRRSMDTETVLTVSVPEVTSEAIRAVRRCDDVSKVSGQDGTISVTVGEGSKTTVLSALEETDVEVLDFATEESSLEDLFAAYTESEEVPA